MTSGKVLSRKLGEYALQRGADLFGVADLEPATSFYHKPGQFFSGPVPQCSFPGNVS